MNKKIEVLLVEDSEVALQLLVHIINSDESLHVMGTASSGAEALEFLKAKKPDVVLMDIHMNGMDGFETTRRIMESNPVPIIVCTGSFDPDEVAMNFRAIEAGALALVGKPVGLGHPKFEQMAGKLVETVRLMSEVKVVKRWSRARRARSIPSELPPPKIRTPVSRPKVIAIGTSTGGPPVLQTILSGLPRNYSIPVLMVQHIAAGFLPGLVEWLAKTTGFAVQIAEHGEPALAGRAYLAPDGYHMGLNSSGQIALSKKEPENGLRPSVAYLFRSIAAACQENAVAVLLTGMGKDGAEELKILKDLGALTVAQDEDSSVIHGMPGAAIKLEAAQYILSPEKIAAMLASLEKSK